MAEAAMEDEVASGKAGTNARETRPGKAARCKARMCRNTASGNHRTGTAEAAGSEPTAAEAPRREPAAAEAVAAKATAAEAVAAKPTAAEAVAAKATAAEAALEGHSLGRGHRDRAAERRRGDRGNSNFPELSCHPRTLL